MTGSEHRIGGDDSKLRYALLFAFGAMVGTGIRFGMWVLPDSLVDRVTSGLGS